MKYLNLLLTFILLAAVSCFNTPVVTGNIFDYKTGKPVEGAVVKLYYADENSSSKEKYRKVTTDENGSYQIVLRSKTQNHGDKFHIEVKKDGYITLYDNFSIKSDNKIKIYLKGISS
jgi:5-hydroxyisourate hydrolase-like protein (transthyretin family)